MLLTKEVEVRPTGKMIRYYQDKGYDVKHKQPLIIKVEDLPKSSFIRVDVLCDYCQEKVFSITYHGYNQATRHINKHACKNCWSKKEEEVIEMKYGVKNVSQVKEVREKSIETLKRNYGVVVPLQSEEIKCKQIQTIVTTYGVDNISQLDKIKKQKMQTSLKHFGVNNPSQHENVKEKMRNSCISKYGYSNPMQSPEVKSKANKTLCKNGTQKTSKQQLYLCSIYGGKLNYPIAYYAVDICFPEEKLVIEYDGGGHDLRITLGILTQEEFDQKEIVRNNIIKREGYKQMRIISKNDKLPSDTVLLQMLQDARTYFSNYSQHSWIEFNISTSTVRNAENKQGFSYSFGSLRTIKDNDLSIK